MELIEPKYKRNISFQEFIDLYGSDEDEDEENEDDWMSIFS